MDARALTPTVTLSLHIVRVEARTLEHPPTWVDTARQGWVSLQCSGDRHFLAAKRGRSASEPTVARQGAQHRSERVWVEVSGSGPFVCLVLVNKEAHMTTTHSRRQFETLNQAAERTGLSVRTLRRRIAAGLLPAYRSGPRVLRVDPADVDRLMVRVPTA